MEIYPLPLRLSILTTNPTMHYTALICFPYKYDAIAEFGEVLDTILRSGSSFNMYMFQGGTNFGFMSGANYVDSSPFLLADATSYGMSRDCHGMFSGCCCTQYFSNHIRP